MIAQGEFGGAMLAEATGVLRKEIDRLRAELAAEKEQSSGWRRTCERLQIELHAVCLGVTAAAAIRASNAAPPQGRECPQCHSPLEPEWSFCAHCLDAAPPQPCSYPQYCGREVCNCPVGI